MGKITTRNYSLFSNFLNDHRKIGFVHIVSSLRYKNLVNGNIAFTEYLISAIFNFSTNYRDSYFRRGENKLKADLFNFLPK